MPKTENLPLFQCPSDVTLSGVDTYGAGRGVSYVANSIVCARLHCSIGCTHTPGSSKAGAVQRPSQIYLFMDAAETGTAGNHIYTDYSCFNRMGYRHPGGSTVYTTAAAIPSSVGINVTMCDGSAKNMVGNIGIPSNDDGMFTGARLNWADSHAD